jgi:hypothetical protein
MSTNQIYVALLNEGTDVWRPVGATQIRRGIFRIDARAPADDTWQFPQGSHVRCEPHVFDGGEIGLVAVEVLHA